MFQKKGRIELSPITYIRGRSIANAVMLVDESQNISAQDMKTILTRAGEGTKIILTGDVDQIDNQFLDATNNGLVSVIERFKSSELAAHITLTKGERSRLATASANIL
jgi:PhoH-like ATPase